MYTITGDGPQATTKLIALWAGSVKAASLEVLGYDEVRGGVEDELDVVRVRRARLVRVHVLTLPAPAPTLPMPQHGTDGWDGTHTRSPER